MSRLLAVLLLLLSLAACSAQADPAPSRAGRSTTPTPPPPPFRLSHGDALEAVRGVAARGFGRRLTCRRRDADHCRVPGTVSATWFVGVKLLGRRLPDGNGLTEAVTATVTSWPTPVAARRYAARLARTLRRYRGDYDVALRHTGPMRYTPGDRGRGELHRVTSDGWRGLELRRIFHFTFVALPPSYAVVGGRAVLDRGRYVLDLEWVARDQATDRRLSHLPLRLVEALA